MLIFKPGRETLITARIFLQDVCLGAVCDEFKTKLLSEEINEINIVN